MTADRMRRMDAAVVLRSREQGARALRWTLVAALSLGMGLATAIETPAVPPTAAAAPPEASAGSPSAAEIVEKSIAARGGAARWDAIHSLAWVGHIESERLGDQTVRFSLEEVRPNKSRFDIISAHPSQRIWDGKKGWSVHQKETGFPEVDPFTELEERFAREAPGLGGPLISYRTQNVPLAVLGQDQIEGHRCYRIGARMPSGAVQLVWIDAETFLELRFDRPTYSRDGRAGMISVYYRDYKAQDGLTVPTVLEIGGGNGNTKPDRLVIERLAINPEISDARFYKPPTPPHKSEIVVPPSLPQTPGRPAK